MRIAWFPVKDMKENIWYVTKRNGEKGINVCRWNKLDPEGTTREYWDMYGNSTILNTPFLPPTHFLPDVIGDVNYIKDAEK